MPKVLGVIMSKLTHLLFNYQPGLVSLELTQNVCKGRGCRVNILTKKRSKQTKTKNNLKIHKKH